jgi:hypothetical protein
LYSSGPLSLLTANHQAFNDEMPGVNVIKRLCSWSLMLQKDMLGWYSEKSLQTSYDHYFGRGVLSRNGQELFKVAFCSYDTLSHKGSQDYA